MRPALSFEALRQVVVEQQEEIVRFNSLPFALPVYCPNNDENV